MMSRKANEALKWTPNMCHLGRTRRKKDEGRGSGIKGRDERSRGPEILMATAWPMLSPRANQQNPLDNYWKGEVWFMTYRQRVHEKGVFHDLMAKGFMKRVNSTSWYYNRVWNTPVFHDLSATEDIGGSVVHLLEVTEDMGWNFIMWLR